MNLPTRKTEEKASTKIANKEVITVATSRDFVISDLLTHGEQRSPSTGKRKPGTLTEYSLVPETESGSAWPNSPVIPPVGKFPKIGSIFSDPHTIHEVTRIRTKISLCAVN
jgi:hypothetical protein